MLGFKDHFWLRMTLFAWCLGNHLKTRRASDILLKAFGLLDYLVCLFFLMVFEQKQVNASKVLMCFCKSMLYRVVFFLVSVEFSFGISPFSTRCL